jgi:hyperosmotically inducible protein
MRRFAAALVAFVGLAGPAAAQLGDLLFAPKTLIDRAIEARSMADIARDNAIVVDVNAVMVDVGTVSVSTEIYEQRLLVTGLFDDTAKYEKFRKGVRAVKGVRKLYWHVVLMNEKDRKAKKLLGWSDVLVLRTKAGARMVGTRGVADVNFRVTADPFGTVYLIGRARSAEEKKKALARAKDGDGVRKVVDYVVVRP